MTSDEARKPPRRGRSILRRLLTLLSVLLAVAAIGLLVFLARKAQTVDNELHLQRLYNLRVVDALDVGLNRAVTLIADKNASRGGGRAGAKPLKELGKHPGDDEPIHVYEGRYGPYVKHGKTNATLPKEVTPDTVTLEQAVELIDARAKKPAKKKAAPKKKAPAKKKASVKAKD